MRAITSERQRRRGHGLHRAKGIALDARNLDEASHRIAGHAEMMLKRNLGGILHLLVRSPQRRTEARRRHGRGRTHLSLAADLGTRDRGVMLDDGANGRGGEEKGAHPALVGALAVVKVIADDGGNHASRAIGGCRHHLAACGIFLVHRHGVNANPVHHLMGVDGVVATLGKKLVENVCRTAFDLEAARQVPSARQAALHAGVHLMPDAVQFLGQGIAIACPFIGSAHLGNGEPGFASHAQHVGGIDKGKGHRPMAGSLHRVERHRFGMLAL